MSTIFLSHSGIDTDSATSLKKRILTAPAAQEHNLKIWFDKDDLVVGVPWQQQIEKAIAESDTFVVYIGSKGIVNWVDAEVRIALNRAITDPAYRFIPVLSNSAPKPDDLPGFAQQFQCVFDPESDPEQFRKLFESILRTDDAGQLLIENEPFFGLRAIDEDRNHLFFGREKELDTLTSLVHSSNLVLVTGDSGSGKSSLVRAGLVPRFRGGSIADLDGERAENTIWHVITTQPRTKPFVALANAISEAAKKLGMTLSDRGTLSDWAATGNIEKVKQALLCDLPSDRTRILLVIDQFEELFTITDEPLRQPFIDLILELSEPLEDHLHIVITMRRDYVNLCSSHEILKARLEQDNRKAYFTLRRMSDQGFREIVTQPLLLAGINEADRNILANEILRDIGDRAGDLALVQMALDETWHARKLHAGSLIRAYSYIGRVEGAIAQAAEHVRNNLNNVEKQILDKILVHLVRLGDTGGATRRIATSGEFDHKCWILIQKLASKKGKRLLLISGSENNLTVEIAHEALVRAWPYFQNLIQSSASSIRILDLLINRAGTWLSAKHQDERDKHLAVGSDLGNFTNLLNSHKDWLTSDDIRFIETSQNKVTTKEKREKFKSNLLKIAVFVLAITTFLSFRFWHLSNDSLLIANQERENANLSEKSALKNESLAFAAFSKFESKQGNYENGVKLALAGLPWKKDSRRKIHHEIIESLSVARTGQRQIIPAIPHNNSINIYYDPFVFKNNSNILTFDDNYAYLWDVTDGTILFKTIKHNSKIENTIISTDGEKFLTWTINNTLRFWDIKSGSESSPTMRHSKRIHGAILNRDSTKILSWSDDNIIRLWSSKTGNELVPHMSHKNYIYGATFNSNETKILSWSADDTVRLWNIETGEEIKPAMVHDSSVSEAIFNTIGTRILSRTRNGQVNLWNSNNGQKAIPTIKYDSSIRGAIFNEKCSKILTWDYNGSIFLWDAATGKKLLGEMHHSKPIEGVIFNADESKILSWSWDGSARLWYSETGNSVIPTMQHGSSIEGALFDSSESRILTWTVDGTVRVWDSQDGTLISSMKHDDLINGAVFDSNETRILSWSRDGSAQLWDSESGNALTEPMRHQGNMHYAAFNPDESLILTSSDDNFIRAWDIRLGMESLPRILHDHYVAGARYNIDGSLILTWSTDHNAKLWDSSTGIEIEPSMQHNDYVDGALFNYSETRIFTWSRDYKVHIWNAKTGTKVGSPFSHNDRINGAVLNYDESLLLTWSDDTTARLWNLTTKQMELPALKHDGPVTGAAFNMDNSQVLTWSEDGFVRLWDVKTGEHIIFPVYHFDHVEEASFNNDESIILTRSANKIRIINTDNGNLTTDPLRHEAYIRGAVFNKDGSKILSWSADGYINLWETQSGKKILQPIQHDERVNGALFNSDESYIISWSDDGKVKISETSTGHLIMQLVHQDGVSGAIFNKNESRILTLSDDYKARLWDAVTGQILLHPMEHDSYITNAVFNKDESVILTWSYNDWSVRRWDISKLPEGNIIDVACKLLPDKSMSNIEDKYKITTSNICEPNIQKLNISDVAH